MGALLECRFKEQAIFKLFFAWGFLQCLCGESGGPSVSTQRELSTCWGVLFQGGLGISPFQCSERGVLWGPTQKGIPLCLEAPGYPLVLHHPLVSIPSVWIFFSFSLKLKTRIRTRKITQWVKHCTRRPQQVRSTKVNTVLWPCVPAVSHCGESRDRFIRRLI